LVAAIIAGGGAQSMGGGYQLIGTVGQWDANSLATGAERFLGGFWGTAAASGLRISLVGNAVRITWSAGLSGFRLQESAAVTGPDAAWVEVTEPVTVLNGEKQVTYDNPLGSRFFRLAPSP